MEDITVPGTGQNLNAWPFVRTDTSKDFAQLDWDVTKSLARWGKGDGPVEVKACYSSASGGAHECTEPNTITVERTAFNASHAVQDLGPGRLALHTGDYSISSTDVDLAGLTVERSHTTLAPANETGPNGVFGPGWRAGFPNLDGVAGYVFEDHSAEGYLQLKGTDGETRTYLKQPDGLFTGTGDAIGTGSFKQDSATRFTFTGSDSVKTVFTYADGKWGPDYTDAPGDENTVTYIRDTHGRVTQILGKVPEGVTCTASVLKPGCTALKIVYSGDTTATGVGSGWGRYTGTVQRVDYTAYDPASGTMKTTTVAEYSYDSTGHLRESWDPRVSPALKTTYYYNGHGRISQLTPPGQAPWQFDYDTTAHRIAHVTRTDDQNRTVTQAVAYKVPTTGSSAPVDLSATAAAAWAQTGDLPVEGTAVFPASHVPPRNGDGGYGPGSGDWKYAFLSYQDVNGRAVNTAQFGAGTWQITTQRHDAGGRVVWALTAENRNQALVPNDSTDPYVAGRNTSAERADLLASATTYNRDGDVLTETAPARQAVLADGTTASVRLHTVYTYDEGNPNSETTRLTTKVTTSPLVVDGTATPTGADTQTTKYGYEPLVAGDPSGWSLKVATSTTTVMDGQPDLVTRTRYDRAGRVVENRQPGSNGTDAGTISTLYYTAGTHPTVAACGLKPQWAGRVCRNGPESQPSGTPLPVSTTTHGYYGDVTKVVDVSGSTTRTWTFSYDAAGRLTGTGVTATPASQGGEPVPDSTIAYNAQNGQAESTTISGSSITRVFDSFGRITSYTDAGGNTTTTTYNVDGQVATHNDGKSTYTYTYDGNDLNGHEERRGLVTRMDAGAPNGSGMIHYAYNGNGAMTGQWYAHAHMWAAHLYDSTGKEVQRGYGSGAGATWLWFASGPQADGRTRWESGPNGISHQDYDKAGRLTTVRDTYLGACTTRTYTFDDDTNRTSASAYQPDTNGGCSTSTASTSTTSGYDTADRVTDTGYSYDTLGRTLTVPAEDVTGGDAIQIGYHANDMVASLTQGTQTRTFTLDPQGRLRSMTASGPGGSLSPMVNHYADDGDSPAWVTESDGTWTRNITKDGMLSALQSSDGGIELQLSDLHGDVVATVNGAALATGIEAYFDQKEYGTPRAENTVDPSRYGWLGSHQRSSGSLGGLILMGVRLYNPVTGRFLSVDPVEGGSANRYEYAFGDPVNVLDLDGRAAYIYGPWILVRSWYTVEVTQWRLMVNAAAWRLYSRGKHIQQVHHRRVYSKKTRKQVGWEYHLHSKFYFQSKHCYGRWKIQVCYKTPWEFDREKTRTNLYITSAG